MNTSKGSNTPFIPRPHWNARRMSSRPGAFPSKAIHAYVKRGSATMHTARASTSWRKRLRILSTNPRPGLKKYPDRMKNAIRPR